MTENEAVAMVLDVFPGAKVLASNDLRPKAQDLNTPMGVISKTVEEIAEMWVPGMPFDGGVFLRWNESLAQAIARKDLATVKRDCQKYKVWMVRQITKFTLG